MFDHLSSIFLTSFEISQTIIEVTSRVHWVFGGFVLMIGVFGFPTISHNKVCGPVCFRHAGGGEVTYASIISRILATLSAQ